MRNLLGLLVLLFSFGVYSTVLATETALPKSKTIVKEAKAGIFAPITIDTVDLTAFDVGVTEYVQSDTAEIFTPIMETPLLKSNEDADVGWRIRFYMNCYNIPKNSDLNYRHCSLARDKIRNC